MEINKILYNEIKEILLLYEEILELDKIYMSNFLRSDNLNSKDKNIIDDNIKNNIENNLEDKIECDVIDKRCIKLYRKLAKLLHPDKNKNEIEIFIKMSNAYKLNDFITLFMYSYEYDIDYELSNVDIKFIRNEIKKKMEEIEKIKSKIHWEWNLCEDEKMKEEIKSYVKENM